MFNDSQLALHVLIQSSFICLRKLHQCIFIVKLTISLTNKAGEYFLAVKYRRPVDMMLKGGLSANNNH
jgi:hypothetical protein